MSEATSGLDGIRDEALQCQDCRLAATRTQVVFGQGNDSARVMLVGEGPGRVEDEQGLAFVGPAGQLLTKILAGVKLSRDEVFITNIVKCRPPGNRDPQDGEMESCKKYLFRQIEVIQPSIIIALGNVSQRFFLGKSSPGITRIRGQYFPWRDGIQVVPMYHPSYLLRNEARHRGSPKWQMWQDIKELRRRYDELGPTAKAPKGEEA